MSVAFAAGLYLGIKIGFVSCLLLWWIVDRSRRHRT